MKRRKSLSLNLLYFLSGGKHMEKETQNEEIKEFTPTNDYVFKRIFGRKGNEELTKKLLESVTDNKYEEIKLDDTPILEAEVIKGKMGILDVKISAEHESIDIEMQVTKETDIADRMLWYWSKLYINTIKGGDEYGKTKKTICILLADFDVDKLKNVKGFHTKWKIIEDKYREVILTDKFQLDIIELNKLEQYRDKNDGLWQWCKFIKAPEKVSESIMKEYPEIKKAKEELDKINADEHERNIALARERALHDAASLRHDGYVEGYTNGVKEGISKRNVEIVKKLLLKGMSINEVSAITELTEDEIKKLI